jgi:DNA processing protein
MSDITKGEKISTFAPQELLGQPLNDVEQKFAPESLFVVGNLEIPLPTPRVAIVGSRKASPEALKVAKDITKALVKKGVTIVSGLAEGIDTAAHTTAIEEGGRTIAVLGTPLNQVYPRSNFELQQIIMRSHIAISQFPIRQPTLPKNFVFRNRTMALISHASIIVEAGNTSGSLHQGWEALRLGRPLFIWESLFNDSRLSWPKKMREYGAMILSDPEEVFGVLPSSEKILNAFS